LVVVVTGTSPSFDGGAGASEAVGPAVGCMDAAANGLRREDSVKLKHIHTQNVGCGVHNTCRYNGSGFVLDGISCRSGFVLGYNDNS
jgi:hypothetical protein